ncbi:ATPase [Bifidobacterium ramosum]|uniref:ATPase n=1 Tax=Bifidobacterium ramosum TaxID=1798158 RepID=A0A6L4WYI3_9BIFI|nr:ATP-binding protein [Bifidobacterium ramosum]KAB8287123.1 ATPase [Bifidobacterium ramosum]NEG72722.1 AAA family ATPase [Bifidobacterium ramosum]NEG72729.1 AAA family ATPase [Bifidobacterium ramosum]
MQRNLLRRLTAWANTPSDSRKPLLLYGARQTGKTYLLSELAATTFRNDSVRFDLERDARARQAFEQDLTPTTIIRRLSQISGRTITPGHTLLILDEIQASNRALTSLKYFCEDMPGLHIAAAGSLLGVAVNRQGFSMPVGKVHTMTLHPMSFDEFLDATGSGALIDEIRDCYRHAQPFYLHDDMLERFWQYVIVGGMPEAVSRFAATGDYDTVRDIQLTIADLYAADMAKYATPEETARIRDTWRSIPAQLAKDNHKFQYKLVKTGGRASVYSSAISWLLAAGLVNRCTRISNAQLPLAMHEDAAAFKIYMSDTGLLSARSQLEPAIATDREYRSRIDLGGIVENYVGQALSTNGIPLRYWTSGNTAEVDFVIQLADTSAAVPVEVKSSDNTRSRSLSVYRDRYRPDEAIRLSTKNFGIDNGIHSVPLYAAFCIGG